MKVLGGLSGHSGTVPDQNISGYALKGIFFGISQNNKIPTSSFFKKIQVSALLFMS